MSREKLPSRRQCLASKIIWTDPCGGEYSIHVSVGLHPDGRVMEVFATISKTGTLLRTMLAQGVIMASHLLQRGVALADIVYRHADGPATPLEAALIEAEKLSEIYRRGSG